MNTENNRWNIGTVLVQSTALFFITFMLCAVPSILEDTHATLLEGAELPALTQWIQHLLPHDSGVVLCVSVLASITHCCVGLAFIATAESVTLATRRALFWTSATWGIVLFSLLVIAFANAIPYLHVIGRLMTEEEARVEQARMRVWSILTIIYCIALITATIGICVRKKSSNKGLHATG